jgi:hypothetical protein
MQFVKTNTEGGVSKQTFVLVLGANKRKFAQSIEENGPRGSVEFVSH